MASEGLPHVELVAEASRLASQRAIAACAGVLVERFVPPPAYGPEERLRWRRRRP